jgi:hypothetical protein
MTNTPCAYCDSPNASPNMLNFELDLHQYSVAQTARVAYETARYGGSSNKPKTSEGVEDLITEAMPQRNSFKHRFVFICEPCRLEDRHASDRDTPVLGVNCASHETQAALLEKVRALGEADRLEDEKRTSWRDWRQS